MPILPVDPQSLALPTNLPQAAAESYSALMQTMAERTAAQRRVQELDQKMAEHRDAVLDQICSVKDGEYLPIAKNAVVQVHKRRLTLQDGRLSWSVDGTRLSFKDGVQTVGQSTIVEESDYNALPPEVRAQTLDSIKQANVLSVNTSKPLTWTDPMASMFRSLDERFNTSFSTIISLPSSVWSNESTTRRLYVNMIRQGVIELAPNHQGIMTTTESQLRFWCVRKGPRYDALVTALAEERAAKQPAKRITQTPEVAPSDSDAPTRQARKPR